MDDGDSNPGLPAPPRAEAAPAQGLSQTFDQAAARTVRSEVGQCPRENIGEALLGAQVPPGGRGAPPALLPKASAAAAAAAGQLIGVKKRGRPHKGYTVAPKPTPPKRSKEEEEEDVCFICFDGGSLVLCDRKRCPKAYHPACIKRDESFFRSKAKWNCGWHICSVCQKAAHYMCYMCTYSLCKACTKDAEYVCVRGNKGFCTACMKIIMLIENKDMGNKEVVQVDFDDKTSWEYLFKVYWICLKGNLSLTIDDLIEAKSPWRGVPMTGYKLQPPDTNHFTNVSVLSIPEKSSEHLEPKMPTEQLELLNHDSVGTGKPSIDNSRTFVKSKDWASKALLELVAHMRSGDTSVLSEFDVQALLLEYIKTNNLRDPRRKSQIVCDSRLKNIFGKPRVGHIEMLKLLEYHFLLKENGQKNAFIPAGIVGSVAGDMSADQNNNIMFDLNKKHRTRKKCEENAPQINLDEYAAINSHNIGLIYLRQNLVENLLGDEEGFHDKVVGSFVRIRISSNDQKQDMYRLVQVVGTSKAAEPYKVVDKTTNIMLNVVNLNKKENVSMDAISNQQFSQEECRHLCECIRFGLVKQFTVGEIQTKAMALQELKLNDVLEAEIMRLNHLRDRANEKGRKKDLRECVEKLHHLKMPEERQRRLTEIPVVHADQKMVQNYESEDDVAPSSDKRQDEFLGSKRVKFNKIGSQLVPPKAKEERPKRAQQLSEKRDAKHGMQVTASSAPEIIWGNQTVVKPSSVSLSMGSSPAVNTSDMDKMWHYRDPNGRIQGPFAMVQLQKWSLTGYFPADMRIWTIDELNDSLLLTDALNGQFHKAYPLLHNVSHPQEVGPASNNGALHSFDLQQNIVSIVHQGSRYEGEEYKSVLNHGIQNSQETAVHQMADKQSQKPSNNQSHACQSSGENSRPLSLNLDLNHQDSNLASLVMPNDSTGDFFDLPSPMQKSRSENLEGQATEKQESRLDVPLQDAGRSDLPTATPKSMNEDMPSPALKEMQENLIRSTPKPVNEVLQSASRNPTYRDQGEQIAKSKQSVLSKVSVPDSGPNWSSSLEVDGSQLQRISNEWAGYSSSDPKPPVEGWNSGLVAMASVKPTDALSEQVAAPSSNTNHLAHSTDTEPHAAAIPSSWQAVVHEPIEFSALGEESVSDLLAEVDAMESQSGLASPSSAIRYSDEMMDSCRTDCFSSIEELSPTPDAGKSDAVSPGEVQFPSRCPMADDPGVVSQADVCDPLKRSDGHSATSSEGETKSADTPLNAREPGTDVHPAAVCASSQGSAPAPMSRNRGLEPIDTGWHGSQGNMNMGWGGSPQGFPNIGWGPCLGGPWGNPNFNLGAYNASLGWDSPRRYGGERFAVPREWGFQGPDPGFDGGRLLWSRQPHGGGSGGGGGYSRPTPKGQRVCKFYESGHCKKGASCDYLHP